MAVLIINPIKSSLSDSLNYITNSEKTENKSLISSYGCSAETETTIKEFEMVRNFSLRKRNDEVIARHIKQSFSPEDNLSPEMCHKIGVEFCEKVFKGQYQYVISTHTDKAHLHNHIIFNTTNIKTHKKYRSNKNSYKELQKTSDELCSQYNLNIIPPKLSKEKGKSYKEWSENKKGTSFKSIMKRDIDECINTASSYEEFKENMQKRGYEIKDYNSKGEYLKYISFKNENIGMNKYFRGRDTLLGEKYTRENIQLRIVSKYLDGIYESKDPLSKIIDINKNKKANSIINYRKFANKNNIAVLSMTKEFMAKNKIKNYDELKNYVSTLEEKIKGIQENLVYLQSKNNTLTTIISSYEIYKETIDVYKEYKQITDSNQKKTFYLKNKKQIQDFQKSKEILLKNFPNKVISQYENLTNESKEINEYIYLEMEKFKKLEEDFVDAKIALKNMNIVLNSDLKTQVKKRIQSGQTAKFNLKSEIQKKVRKEILTNSKKEK